MLFFKQVHKFERKHVMSDSDRISKDKYVDLPREQKTPEEVVVQAAKNGTHAVIRGWNRVLRYLNQGK